MKERIREDILFVKQQMEELLNQNTESAHQALVQVVQMPYVRMLTDGDNELKIMELLARIYKTESEQGIKQTILNTGSSMNDVVDVYYKLLFFLERIWFDTEEEYQRELVSYADRQKISPYAIYMILEDSRISEKKEVWAKVMKLWEKQYE